MNIIFLHTFFASSYFRGYGRSALRNWVFQVSKDGQNWSTLYTHIDDGSLNEPGYSLYLSFSSDPCLQMNIWWVLTQVCVHSSTATWPLDPSKDEKQGWRHIRIKQMGKNASGQTHYLSLSGLELYGTVTAVCEDQLGEKTLQSEGKLSLYISGITDML